MKHPNPSPRRIPLAIKLAYTAFVAVMVPYYWHAYGPQNFLYFCDVAVLVTLVAIWLESASLVSVEAVAILLPQTIWILDFVSRLVGFHLIGLTDYMFDPKLPLFVRGLSLFHGWLPLLIVWMLFRLGYDRRAMALQTIAGVGLVLICYFCFAPPTAVGDVVRSGANINYVYGFSEKTEQHMMPALAWLAIVATGIPTLLYLPTHFVLKKCVRETRRTFFDDFVDAPIAGLGIRFS